MSQSISSSQRLEAEFNELQNSIKESVSILGKLKDIQEQFSEMADNYNKVKALTETAETELNLFKKTTNDLVAEHRKSSLQLQDTGKDLVKAATEYQDKLQSANDTFRTTFKAENDTFQSALKKEYDDTRIDIFSEVKSIKAAISKENEDIIKSLKESNERLVLQADKIKRINRRLRALTVWSIFSGLIAIATSAGIFYLLFRS